MRQSSLRSLMFMAFIGLYTFSVTSCNDEEDDGLVPDTLESEVLDCKYFDSGTNRILVDNPDLTVDYIITCRASVSVDVIIEPGVVIEFQEDTGLEIGDNGSLKAIGTADQPIILTGANKTAGSWLGVLIRADDIKNELNYVTIEYAGGGAFNSNDNEAALIMWAASRAKIDNCTFSNSGNYGLELDYSEVDIPSFTNNTFINNNIPVYAKSDYLGIFDASSTYTGNTNDYFVIGCASMPEGDYIWHNIDVPYRVESRDSGNTKKISISDNTDVTIEPGTTITFDASTQIEVSGNGSMKAIGTVGEMITFKGVDEVAGAWEGLEFRFTENVNNELDYIKLQHAGSGDNDAAIYMWAEPKLSVTNSIFEDIDGCAFKDGTGSSSGFDNANFSESNNTFTSTGSTFCP